MKTFLKVKAESLGFDLFGVTTPLPGQHLEAYRVWLSEGMHGDMHYLERHLPLKEDPLLLFPEMQSIVVVACNYWNEAPTALAASVASYARGEDYHGFMKAMLESLGQSAQAQDPDFQYRSFVDSGPLMERDLAQRAGLGWLGKNNCLIHPQKGSWFLLGCLLTNATLAPDRPFENFHCGSCSRCIDACPTQTLTAPHQLDARRCIAYWTIEQREEIPDALREPIGELLFGCDICQAVCPWNERFATPTPHAAFAPKAWLSDKNLETLVLMTEHDFMIQIAPRSPIKRPKYRGFLRNVSLVMGNQKQARFIAPLQQALKNHHQDPMLVNHFQWALDRCQRSNAMTTHAIS